jgi:serine/threonine protein kinase
MTVLGKGTFGCVVSPALKCTDSSIKPDKRVSKIMRENDALDEMQEYKALDKIPELKKYLLRFPELCNPVNDEKFHKAIKQCQHGRINKVYKNPTTKNISSLLLENGGVSLRDFQTKFRGKLTVNDFEIFLTSIKDLFEALIILRKHEYVHQDIKTNNIVYSPKTGKIALIDFGKLTTFKQIKENCGRSTHAEGTSWFNYPPEAKFMNRNKKLLRYEDEYQSFLKKTITTWDSYSLALCLKEMFEKYSISSIKNVLKDVNKDKETRITNFLFKTRALLEPYIGYNPYLNNSMLMDTVSRSVGLRNSNIESLKFTYIELLKDYKLYRVTTPKPSQKVIQIEQDSSVQHIVNNVAAAQKKCKPGKEPHPISNRCVNKCKPGETRDSTGKCQKTKVKTGKKTKSKTAKKNKTSKKSPIASKQPKWYKVAAYLDTDTYECKKK